MSEIIVLRCDACGLETRDWHEYEYEWLQTTDGDDLCARCAALNLAQAVAADTGGTG